jgi:hypothetical protein
VRDLLRGWVSVFDSDLALLMLQLAETPTVDECDGDLLGLRVFAPVVVFDWDCSTDNDKDDVNDTDWTGLGDCDTVTLAVCRMVGLVVNDCGGVSDGLRVGDAVSWFDVEGDGVGWFELLTEAEDDN